MERHIALFKAVEANSLEGVTLAEIAAVLDHVAELERHLGDYRIAVANNGIAMVPGALQAKLSGDPGNSIVVNRAREARLKGINERLDSAYNAIHAAASLVDEEDEGASPTLPVELTSAIAQLRRLAQGTCWTSALALKLARADVERQRPRMAEDPGAASNDPQRPHSD